MDTDPAFLGAGGIGIEKHIGIDVILESSAVYLAKTSGQRIAISEGQETKEELHNSLRSWWNHRTNQELFGRNIIHLSYSKIAYITVNEHHETSFWRGDPPGLATAWSDIPSWVFPEMAYTKFMITCMLHFRESYPESCPRIIPANHTSETYLRISKGGRNIPRNIPPNHTSETYLESYPLMQHALLGTEFSEKAS